MSILSSWATQWAANAIGSGAIYDTNHILYFLTAVLLVWLLVLLFRNRFFIYRERELEAQAAIPTGQRSGNTECD